MAGVAVLVLHTLGGGNGCAANVGISGIADRTATLGLVFGHQALRVLCAGVLVQTRVDTVLVPASFVLWTLGVTPAADDLTCNERIAFIARNTSAHGPVLGGITLGKSAAGILYQTRVHAVAVNAGFLVSTFSITLATDRLASNLGITNETWRTHADRSMVLDEARGA